MKLASTLILSLAAVAAWAADGPKMPANLPKDLEPAFRTWAGRCSQCHNPERAYTPKYSDEKSIRALVGRMARKPGAAISGGDQKQIVAYLTWYHKQDGK